MNEFILVDAPAKSHNQIVLGLMGITADQLIRRILDNKDGEFDRLFATAEAVAAK